MLNYKKYKYFFIFVYLFSTVSLSNDIVKKCTNDIYPYDSNLASFDRVQGGIAESRLKYTKDNKTGLTEYRIAVWTTVESVVQEYRLYYLLDNNKLLVHINDEFYYGRTLQNGTAEIGEYSNRITTETFSNFEIFHDDENNRIQFKKTLPKYFVALQKDVKLLDKVLQDKKKIEKCENN